MHQEMEGGLREYLGGKNKDGRNKKQLILNGHSQELNRNED
jgi:hypothetical protein